MIQISSDNRFPLPFIARIDSVVALVGISRANIYEQVKNGTFPHPRKLSSKSIGWHIDDLKKWADSLPSNQSTLHGGNHD